MSKMIYTFALFLAVLTFVLCIIGGISIFTGFVRSALVFLGVLFTFSIAGHLLRLVVVMGEKHSQRESEQTQTAQEEAKNEV